MTVLGVTMREKLLECVALDETDRRFEHYRALRFAGGMIVQVTADHAGLFCGMRPDGLGGADYTDGCRIIIFDALDRITSDQSVLVRENQVLGDLHAGDARLTMTGDMWAWFVPVGALNADGTPHPHAGTGFGIGLEIIVPVKPDLNFDYQDLLSDSTKHTVIYQLAYRGDHLEVTHLQRHIGAELPAVPTTPITAQMLATAQGDETRFRWRFSGAGLGGGIPDGDQMLMPAMALPNQINTADRPADFDAESAGVMRWAVTDGQWRPVAFTPIAITAARGEQFWHEPSLVRLTDGSLLFTARPRCGAYENAIRIWHSDDGLAWRVVFDTIKLRAESPLTLNAGLDGAPYLAFNPYRPGYETRPYGFGRRRLAARQFQPDSGTLGDEFIIKDTGEPPEDTPRWYLDHPITATVRLGDGMWHHMMTFRSLYGGPDHHLPAAGPGYGMYVTEFEAGQPVTAPWQFK